MKYSQFLTVFELTPNASLLYSAYQDKFLVFKPKFTSVFKNMVSAGEIKLQYPNFYKQLVKAGALIPDIVDEYKEIIETSRKYETESDSFHLIVNPTLDCNFKCWYCYENHKVGSKIDKSMIEKINQLISIKLNDTNIQSFHLGFFGGEPLIGYEHTVKPIIDHAAAISDEFNKHLSVSFTSNAGLISQRIIDHISGLKTKPHFQITLDGSRDCHNKVRFWRNGKGSYDIILENVQKLLEVGSQILLRINFTKENYRSCNDILTDILGLNLNKYDNFSVIFRQVWQDIDQDPQIDEEMAEIVNKFRNEGFGVQAPLDLNHRNFSCYADRTNQALVNYNGDVFKCTARDFDTSKRLGFLNDSGELVWEVETPEERVCRKYTKQICQKCRIFPLCGGGCSQKAIEGEDMDTEVCNYGSDENIKTRIILNRFYQQHVLNTK